MIYKQDFGVDYSILEFYFRGRKSMLCTEHWLCIRQMDLHISPPSQSSLHDFVLPFHEIHGRDVSRIISAWTEWFLAGTWVHEGLWSIPHSFPHRVCDPKGYLFCLSIKSLSRLILTENLPPERPPSSQLRLLPHPQAPVSQSTRPVIWDSP